MSNMELLFIGKPSRCRGVRRVV